MKILNNDSWTAIVSPYPALRAPLPQGKGNSAHSGTGVPWPESIYITTKESVFSTKLSLKIHHPLFSAKQNVSIISC